MTKSENLIVTDFLSTLKPELKGLVDLLDALVPVNEQDAKLFSIGKDMIESVLEDIDSGINNVISASIDLDKVVDSWDEVKPLVTQYDNMYTMSDIVAEVESTYGVDDDEDY